MTNHDRSIHLYVDADACPVKEETFKVARRHGLAVSLVANTWMHIPQAHWLELVVVGNQPDEADNWIAEHAGEWDVVVTADIPLAARCLKKGAAVVGPTGKAFDEDSIADVLATRDILADMRDLGMVTKGPPPFQKKDRSRFLHQLDETIRRIQRRPG